MKKITPVIRNKQGERLDTWVEEPNANPKASVVMVHGFGTDKNETAGYFFDLSAALVEDGFRVIRFDLSGYGKSEGNQENGCYTKHSQDVDVIIDWVKAEYSGKIYIFAQSMGCWVTALASPDGIAKTIMTGIPNANTDIVIKRVADRFGSRPGAKLNFDGLSLLPRSTGKIQKIGAKFWDDLKNFNPVESIKGFAKKSQLLIVHWNEDEIIGLDYLAEYDSLKGVKALYLPGNHSVSNPGDRKSFINVMLDYYNN